MTDPSSDVNRQGTTEQRTHFYQEQIRPLVEQIYDACKSKNIPCILTFQLSPPAENIESAPCSTSAFIPEGSLTHYFVIADLLTISVHPEPEA